MKRARPRLTYNDSFLRLREHFGPLCEWPAALPKLFFKQPEEYGALFFFKALRRPLQTLGEMGWPGDLARLRHRPLLYVDSTSPHSWNCGWRYLTEDRHETPAILAPCPTPEGMDPRVREMTIVHQRLDVPSRMSDLTRAHVLRQRYLEATGIELTVWQVATQISSAWNHVEILAQLIDELEPPAILLQNPRSARGIALIQAARRRSIPCVEILHGQPCEGYAVATVEAVVVPNEQILEQYRAWRYEGELIVSDRIWSFDEERYRCAPREPKGILVLDNDYPEANDAIWPGVLDEVCRTVNGWKDQQHPWRVRFRRHPRNIAERPEPAFDCADGPLEEALAGCVAVVGAGSTVLHQAAERGLPVFVLESAQTAQTWPAPEGPNVEVLWPDRWDEALPRAARFLEGAMPSTPRPALSR